MNIARLPYFTAVCNETLRIYPVIVLTAPREVSAPMELLGYLLEPGTRLFGCIYLTHPRQDIYPKPKQFKPERFLDHQFSPYEFFPFGGGVRRCIGEALALYEMKLVLATMLTRYLLALNGLKARTSETTGGDDGACKRSQNGHARSAVEIGASFRQCFLKPHSQGWSRP